MHFALPQKAIIAKRMLRGIQTTFKPLIYIAFYTN